MSGHSHWAGIKHKKGLQDAKRGKEFSKLGKAIMAATRTGGTDPDGNVKLRYAIDKAKAANMPKDTIERAILKGAGQLEGHALEELVYEGYGPSGVAVMVEVLTDNKNRTAAELRKLFDVHGGNMGGSGSVAWMFQPRGLITIKKDAIDEDQLMELALEAGADDVQTLSDTYELTCAPSDFAAVKNALSARGLELESADLTKIPQTTVKLEDSAARKVLRLMEALEDNEDVQNVYANFEISEKLSAELSQ
ncbi:MAG TPA: YebC/PmpR family DNA-binding transcriptional regulator [Planctomycetota bacterium]|nr:YebC/PmpR family DNA-binding transcriptional regulator [Planctomycetota bacterium]